MIQQSHNNSENNNQAIRIKFNDYGSTFKRILEKLCDGITISQQFKDYDTIIIEDYDNLLSCDKNLVNKIINKLSEKNIVYY